MSEELGSAHVKLTADTSNLEAGLNSAKGLAGSAAKDIAAGADAATVASNGFMRAVGRLGASFPAVTAAAVAAFGAISLKIKAEKDEAEELRKELEKVTKAYLDFYQAAEKGDKGTGGRVLQLIDRMVREKIAFEDAIKSGADPEDLRKMKEGIIYTQRQIAAAEKKEKADRLAEQTNADIEAAKTSAEARQALEDKEFDEYMRKQTAKWDALERQKKLLSDMAEIQRKADEDRINSILEATKALEAMYDRQRAGFGNNDGSSSIQGGFDMLAREIQAGFSRMGNGA